VSAGAISWALNLALVPADRGGQPSSACKFVLAGLANHAGPDGTGAFPSVATLGRYTGLAERTVRTCLDRLAAAGIIAPCDPGIVAARIKRADRRPQGWDLNLSLVRDDLDKAAIAVLDHQFPGLGANGQADGVQPARRRGATSAATGCSGCTRTVHGPSGEPSTASARGRAALPAADGPSSGRAGKFYYARDPAWRLTAAQRSRLTPAVLAALDEGWTPQQLARFAGANTEYSPLCGIAGSAPRERRSAGSARDVSCRAWELDPLAVVC
jgi:Helix-turn-helix domain